MNLQMAFYMTMLLWLELIGYWKLILFIIDQENNVKMPRNVLRILVAIWMCFVLVIFNITLLKDLMFSSYYVSQFEKEKELFQAVLKQQAYFNTPDETFKSIEVFVRSC